MVTKPFDGEDLQGLAHRRAADAQLGAELQLIDPAAGFELAAEDLLAQAFGDLLVQGAGGEGRGGRHGFERSSVSDSSQF